MLTLQALSNKKITVFGGKQVRPNIHILEMVNVYKHFLNNDIKSGCYNAGFENISIINIDFGWGERNKEFLWNGELQFKNIDIIAIENKFRGPEIVSPLDKKSKYSFFIPEVKKFKNKLFTRDIFNYL